MELNVTAILNHDLWPCYGSVATHGTNAGASTWAAAKKTSNDAMIVSDENRDGLRCHFESYGAWDSEEIAAWTDLELNALIIQDVCSALSDVGLDLDTLDELTQCEIIEALNNENCDGRLFLCDDGEYYFYIG